MILAFAYSETLYEDDHFLERSLAAMVASKVFYHLEELDDAVRFALGADRMFDVEVNTPYIQTLTSKCIDDYIKLRSEQSHTQQSAQSSLPSPSDVKIDDRLIAIVERMFDRCQRDGAYTQALGIAIESHRLDQVSKTINLAPQNEKSALLSYTYDLTLSVTLTRDFHRQLLKLLVELYHTVTSEPNYQQIAQCLLFLDDHEKVADTLNTLLKKGGDHALLAYQIAFDLGENQNAPFLIKVAAALPKVESVEVKPEVAVSASQPVASADTTSTPLLAPESVSAANPAPSTSNNDAMDTTASVVDEYPLGMQKLRRILSGEVAIDLYLHFLYEHNATDLNILKSIKDKLETRNSVTHNATVMAHGIMHCGTTVDVFLRDNLEW